MSLLTRSEFRNQVFARDNSKCVVCGVHAVDAHHILERRLWVDGGYYLDNGASVCAECHLKAESTDITVEELREACGAKKILPTHLYNDVVYDKWGNEILSDGMRLKGELFDDPSVQKILLPHLCKFRVWVKYPRTFHLPWSPGMNSDDRQMQSVQEFVGQKVVVTRKMDGENTSLYSEHIHARSIDSRSHPSQSWVRNFHAQIAHDIPAGWRVCGENLYAKHSIGYSGLDTYFLGFSVWNDRNICLSWHDTVEFFELIGIKSVPVLYHGMFDEEHIRSLQGNWETDEGYVMRVAHAFHYSSFRYLVGKSVRAGHVNTVEHWRTSWERNL